MEGWFGGTRFHSNYSETAVVGAMPTGGFLFLVNQVADQQFTISRLLDFSIDIPVTGILDMTVTA